MCVCVLLIFNAFLSSIYANRENQCRSTTSWCSLKKKSNNLFDTFQHKERVSFIAKQKWEKQILKINSAEEGRNVLETKVNEQMTLVHLKSFLK